MIVGKNKILKDVYGEDRNTHTKGKGRERNLSILT